MQHFETEKPIEERSDSSWKIYLLALCSAVFAAVILIGHQSLDLANPDVAYNVGFYTPIALIVSGIFYSVVGKGNKSVFGLSFIAVLATCVAAAMVNFETQKREVASQLGTFVDEVEEIIDESWEESPEGPLPTIEKKFTAPDDSKGPMKEAQMFMARIMNDYVAIQNEYVMELNEAGLERFFDADRIANDTDFRESREMLAMFNQAYTKFSQTFNQYVSDSPAMIDELELSEQFKKDFRAGFLRGLEGSKHMRERNLYLEEAVLREAELMIDFLEANQRSWTVEDGQFLFDTDEQVATYNHHLQNMQMYAAEQEQIQRDMIENQRQKVQDMEF
jgi:hypothetical protein